MGNYKNEETITVEEGKELLKDACWHEIGETTNGNIYWNNKTGELLYDGYWHKCYEIVRINK